MTDRVIKNKLAELMKKERYDSKSLSKVISIDQRTISKVKSNTGKSVSYDTLLILCEFFKVDISEFLYIGENKNGK